MSQVIVEDSNPEWGHHFHMIRDQLWPYVQDYCERIEHVGSTAIPELPAKPIIDIDIVIKKWDDFPLVKSALESIHYEHRGDLGIKGRESFKAEDPLFPHHLYVILESSLAYKNHRSLKDYLINHQDERLRYGELKKKLAEKYPEDIDSYIQGKTPLILEFLKKAGMTKEELQAIKNANQ